MLDALTGLDWADAPVWAVLAALVLLGVFVDVRWSRGEGLRIRAGFAVPWLPGGWRKGKTPDEP